MKSKSVPRIAIEALALLVVLGAVWGAGLALLSVLHPELFRALRGYVPAGLALHGCWLHLNDRTKVNV